MREHIASPGAETAPCPDQSCAPEANLGLARSCAARYIGRGIEYEELYGAACLGLVKAAKGFDPSRGLRFSTYAVPVIMGEIRQLFRQSSPVKLSREMASLCSRAGNICEIFAAENGREPRLSELAELLGVSPEQAAQVMCASRRPLSLSPSDGDDDRPATEVPVPSFENGMIENIALRQAIDSLSEADRALIIERYVNGLTQSAAAARLGMTQVQVSRRERRILCALRDMMQ